MKAKPSRLVSGKLTENLELLTVAHILFVYRRSIRLLVFFTHTPSSRYSGRLCAVEEEQARLVDVQSSHI